MAGPKTIDSKSLSIGEVLRKPYSYKVPFYQRDYSWKKEEITTLWDDLISYFGEGGDVEYFMGVIVIAPGESEKTKFIVDGQQRIASLSMIFSAIAAMWEEREEEKRATGVARDYLGSEDRRTGSIIPKLSLNETNDRAFQQVVLNREIVSLSERKLWPKTNKLIYEAYDIIKKSLERWLNTFDDKESSLLDLEDYISEKLNLIEIQVNDDSDAFIIFETLNDRGLELAVADLVKNYLFSLGGHNIEKFKQIWIEVSMLVGKENITQFLRHYWLSFFGLVRERDLYKSIKSKVKSKTTALQFIIDLRKSADHYSALLSPQHSFWGDFDPKISNYLESLILFRVSQYRPVALAAMKMLEPAKVGKIIQNLMVISFRYTVISSLGTGNLERIYSNAALSISKGESNTPKRVFSMLKKAYVDEETFKDNFITAKIGKANIARYILANINDYLEENEEKEVSKDVHKITLEHILPQNPNEEWKNSYKTKEEHLQWVDTIGNFTLVEKNINKNIGNVSFLKKRNEAYSKSELFLNKDLSEYKEWNTSYIEKRAKKLSELAEKKWTIAY